MDGYRLTRWLNKLVKMDKRLREHDIYHRDLIPKVEKVVKEMNEYPTQLAPFVKAEDPRLFELLAIFASYSESPGDVFKQLHQKKIFSSCDFFIGWSKVLEKHGQNTQALEVLSLGIYVNPNHRRLLKMHHSRVSQLTQCVQRKSSDYNHSEFFKQVANDLVKVFDLSLSSDELSPAPPGCQANEKHKRINFKFRVPVSPGVKCKTSNDQPESSEEEVTDPSSSSDEDDETFQPRPTQVKQGNQRSSKKVPTNEQHKRMASVPSSEQSLPSPPTKKRKSINKLSTNERPTSSSNLIILKPSAKFIGNETLLTEGQLRQAMKFEVHSPPNSRLYKKWSNKVQCMGCSATFPTKQRYYSADYYHHCIKQCEGYKQLGNISVKLPNWLIVNY